MSVKTTDLVWIVMGCLVAFSSAVWCGLKLGIPGFFVGALAGFLGFYGVALTAYKLNKLIRKTYSNNRRTK